MGLRYLLDRDQDRTLGHWMLTHSELRTDRMLKSPARFRADLFLR